MAWSATLGAVLVGLVVVYVFAITGNTSVQGTAESWTVVIGWFAAGSTLLTAGFCTILASWKAATVWAVISLVLLSVMILATLAIGR